MKKWVTQITAVDPVTGQLAEYAGPHVEAVSYAAAIQYCQTHELGYCRVIGEFVSEERSDLEAVKVEVIKIDIRDN
jgi:hypothetical protein